MPILIFEGFNGVGKSTIINRLCQENSKFISINVKKNVVPEYRFYKDMVYSFEEKFYSILESIKKLPYVFVINRWLWTEYAYSSVFKRFNPSIVNIMKNLSQDYGVILLVASKNEIRRRLFERYMHPTPVDFYINYYDNIMRKFYESLKLTTAYTAIVRNNDISSACRKIIDIVKEWWNL